MVETPDTNPEGSGRNLPSDGIGAPNTAATNERAHFKSDKVMEAVVERENMRRALHRVVSNKGAPGVDKMRVEELNPHLKENWESIKEELLQGNYVNSPGFRRDF